MNDTPAPDNPQPPSEPPTTPTHQKTEDSAKQLDLEPGKRSRFSLLGTVFGPFLALAVVIAFFGIADSLTEDGGSFLTIQNLRTLSAQTATVAVAALGMTLVIIAGGIDLSAGTAVALSATVLAWCLMEDVALYMGHGETPKDVLNWVPPNETPGEGFQSQSLEQLYQERGRTERRLKVYTRNPARFQDKIPELQTNLDEINRIIGEREVRLTAAREASKKWTRWTPLLAVLITLFIGCLSGWVNGFLISYLKVVPFIVTLGTMRIFLGVAKQIAKETTVRPNKQTQIPDWLTYFLSIREEGLYPVWNTGVDFLDRWLQVLRFPLGVWLAIIMAVVLAAILRYTVFGRYVFALGSNESTARLCGINVRWNKIAVYTLGGLFVGIAGIYQFARISVGNPTSGLGLELNIIAAVVIGGGSLNGGRGSVLGTLTGAAIMAVITSGCTQLGLKNPIQDIILGSIIVAAVTLDQIRTRQSG